MSLICFEGVQLQPRRDHHKISGGFSRRARVGTGAPARLSRAKLGSCRWPHQLWICHAACCLAVLFLFAAVSSADVLKVTVNDAIQPVTAEYIGRALDLAAANHD